MGEAARVFPIAKFNRQGVRPPDRAAETSATFLAAYRALAERLATLRSPCFWPAIPGKPPLPQAERIGVFRLMAAMPGVPGEEEMQALVEAMRHAPSGDVVEIGSGHGGTAALLTWLARRYEIGNVLCVDGWEADEALQIFEINLAPLAEGRLNYLRAGAAEAASRYEANALRTETFGETRYEGRIALLRIATTEADSALAHWAPKVAGGGWIVFGGVAANEAAEAFAEREAARISARFQAGTELFLQLKR